MSSPTAAHCAYCFEVLTASLEKREALSLKEVKLLWTEYKHGTQSVQSGGESADEANDEVDMIEDDDEDTEEGEGRPDDDGDDDGEGSHSRDLPPDQVSSFLRPKDLSRLQDLSPASGSSSSTPSTLSTTSSQAALGDASKSSSKSSFFSFSRKPHPSPVKKEEYPLFVTWNTMTARGFKSLRGCIGTFEALELSSGLRSYALTSAFDDTRFAPIAFSELPSLSCTITLLMNFTPCADPLDWDLDTHGIRISFAHQSRRYSATYLPDIAVEQGWNKEETILSLMRKAGWSGRSKDWTKVSELKCIRYEGKKASLGYQTWKEWRDWVDADGNRR